MTAPTLRRAIVLPAALGTLLISAAVGAALAFMYWRDANVRLDRDMTGALQAVAQSAASAAWNVDRQAAALIVQGLVNDPRVSRIVFLSDSFPAIERGSPAVGSRQFEQELVFEARGLREVVGRIQIETDPHFVNAPLLNAAIENGLILTVIVFAASLWVLLLLDYRVTRPILKLAAHARELAQRKLSDVTPLDLRRIGQVEEVQALGRTLEELRSGNLTTLNELAEQRRAELEAQQSKLDAMVRLSGGLAHEFSNLLLPIASLSAMGVKATALDQATLDRLLSYFRRINETATQASTIARDFLTFSGATRRPAEIADLSAALREAARTVQPILPADGKIDLAAEPGILARFDRVGLTQVLMNLVKNSVQAFKPGQGAQNRLEIAVALTRRNGEIRIELLDNGSGMTEAVRARMFEPFFSTKGASGGFGLGLAVVYGVVTSWGGKIEARNQPGGGAAFIITLPAVAESAAERLSSA